MKELLEEEQRQLQREGDKRVVLPVTVRFHTLADLVKKFKNWRVKK